MKTLTIVDWMKAVKPYPLGTGKDRAFYGDCPVSDGCDPEKVMVNGQEDPHVSIITRNRVYSHIKSNHKDCVVDEPPAE